MASYSKGSAMEGSGDAFSLYPRDYVEDKVPAGQDSLEEYAEKKYFSNLKQWERRVLLLNQTTCLSLLFNITSEPTV